MSHQLINIRLQRNDASPWGFRLQGGKDFAQPLLIQKVNGGSLSERAGLQVGDALIKVNNIEVYNMRHKEAQDALVRAGNNFELVVERGPGATWKPQVSNVGAVPNPGTGAASPVTKTSLAAKPTTPVMPSGHNLTPRPFGGSPQMGGGGADTVKAIVNKQYNTPVNIYSEESIAETLSAQAEVLAGGVLGVNFKKNERTYDSNKSEVFKMVQEVENEPRSPEPAASCGSKYFSQVSHAVGGRATSPRPLTPLAKQMGSDGHDPSAQLPAFLGQHGPSHSQAVSAPPSVPAPQPMAPQPMAQPIAPQPSSDKPMPSDQTPYMPQGDPSQPSPKCSDCGKLIVGVFVRIKDKNLHVECFKCSTCGTSLKNVGYYNINNKLYCDIHAKMVARQNPPAPNMEPVTIPPASKIPSGLISNLASAAAKPSSPQPVSAPTPPTYPAPLPTSGPKPFGASPAATFTVPAASPVAPPAAAHPAQPPAHTGPIVQWPPNLPTAPAPAPKPPQPSEKDYIITQTKELNGIKPVCNKCNLHITRGPFITALGKIWCPEHFICVNGDCRRPLQDIGFVEENEGLYCEFCFEKYLAPNCSKCNIKIKGDCLNAIGKQFHPECFTCTYCNKMFGNNPFFLEDSLPYCEADWNELFTTKCFSCGFPIEAGDRWVEALNNNYHSQCFNCTMCKKNLEGQSFFAKGGRPFCKNHAR